MPTYDYECRSCQHKFERFHSITAKPIRVCPKCHKRRVIRLIGAGAGIIFKGSGFYQTDYRSESYEQGAKNAEPTSGGASDGSKDKANKADKPGGKSEHTSEKKES